MHLKTTLALVISVSFLGACTSTPIYSGDRSWKDGWRQGVIESVNDSLKWNQVASCSRSVAPGEKIVVVKYRASNKPRWKFIPMSAKDAPPAHTNVLINANNCEVVRRA